MALAILSFSNLSGASVAASSENSVSAPLPRIERPGPPPGRLGSVSSSRRTAVIAGSSGFAVNFTVCLVGA